MPDALKSVPLESWHRDQGARMGPFAGFSMPIQYEGIIAEHLSVRQRAGLFDVSHMGEAEVTGPAATDFLEFVCTNRVAGLPVGKAVYSVLVNEAGGAVDDIIVYHRQEGTFFICLNAANKDKDIAWLQTHANAFDCTVRDVSSDYAQLAIQGPAAWDILSACGSVTPATLKRFHGVDTLIADCPVFLSRTGYTGEDGAELYFHPAHGPALIAALFAAGTPLGLVPCGLGARDTLRLEAGYPLYGHELTDTLGPLQAGLGWTVKFDAKGDFLGRRALEEGETKGWPEKVAHFITRDRRILREGTPILQDSQVVGRVLSGGFSPILNSSMGSALLSTSADPSLPLSADIRGQSVPVHLAKPPLHFTN